VNAFLCVVSAEWFKLLRKRRTYVLAGLWWLLLPSLALLVGRVLVSNLGASFANEAGGVDTVVQNLASPFGLARIGLVGPGYLSPTFYIIVVAAFAAVLIGDERTHNMWKTVLVAQPARWAVLAGKLAVAMLAAGALLVGALVAAVLFGAVGTTFLPTDFGGDWVGLLGLYALQWLFLVAVVAFAFLMVFIARNVAVGLIAVFFLPGLLEGLYAIYAAIVGFQPVNRFNLFLQAIRFRQVLEDLPTYFFTANVYAPARAPVRDLAAAFGAEMARESGGQAPDLGALLGTGITLERAALVVGVYAVALLALLAWRFLRADVD
jgi:ABC-type transport system involved in multi-copper enzyme maturation permease subunit